MLNIEILAPNHRLKLTAPRATLEGPQLSRHVRQAMNDKETSSMQTSYSRCALVFATITLVLYIGTRFVLALIHDSMSGLFNSAVLVFANYLTFRYIIWKEGTLLPTLDMVKLMVATLFLACLVIGGAESLLDHFIAEAERKFKLIMIMVFQFIFFIGTFGIFFKSYGSGDQDN